MTTPRAPEILSRDANHVVALYDNVLLQLWLVSVPIEGVNAVVAAGKRFHDAARPFSTLIVVGPNSAPPQSPSRNGLLAFAQQAQPELKCAVLAVESSGLKGAIVRSIMTGMSMVVQSVDTVIVREVSDGVAALKSRGFPADGDDLEGMVMTLRGPSAQIAARQPNRFPQRERSSS